MTSFWYNDHYKNMLVSLRYWFWKLIFTLELCKLRNDRRIAPDMRHFSTQSAILF